MIPPTITHSISPMIPLLPVLAGAVFGVLGLIIHFLTASSTPSPDTSWEHSRHNSLKQLYGGKYAFWSDADLTTWCCGDVTVPWAGWAHILTWPRASHIAWGSSGFQSETNLPCKFCPGTFSNTPKNYKVVHETSASFPDNLISSSLSPTQLMQGAGGFSWSDCQCIL